MLILLILCFSSDLVITSTSKWLEIYLGNVEFNFNLFLIKWTPNQLCVHGHVIQEMIGSPGVKETITMVAEQGAQKQRILGRREDRNSCFLTEEVQMEAQVLLSAAITAARAVAGWWGWRGRHPAALANTRYWLYHTNTHFSFRAVLEEGWDESTAPQPTDTRRADLLVTHTFTHSLLEGTTVENYTCMRKKQPEKIYPSVFKGGSIRRLETTDGIQHLLPNIHERQLKVPEQPRNRTRINLMKRWKTEEEITLVLCLFSLFTVVQTWERETPMPEGHMDDKVHLEVHQVEVVGEYRDWLSFICCIQMPF